MLPIRTILYPTDFSEQSEPAFRLACQLAEHWSAQLVVLYVESELTTAAYEGVMLPDRLDFHEQAEVKLGNVRPRNTSVLVEHCLVQGDPAREIVRKAKEIPCDLIVMGTHGRTGLLRLVLGSVAERVMRSAPCPVLTVKPPAVRDLTRKRAFPEVATTLCGQGSCSYPSS
jgi:nucleotide-binding universal stress UspA family protein